MNEFFNYEWLNDNENNFEKNKEINKYNNNCQISNESNTYEIINNEKKNYDKIVNIREFCDIDNISIKQSFDFNENLPDINFLESEFKKLNK